MQINFLHGISNSKIIKPIRILECFFQNKKIGFFFRSKRGIDFGLGRGFSGSQAAKHFMGMAAARYSGGPGKKRKRSIN